MYNIVLNKVPNNNDVMHIANVMLNKVLNSNDATHVANYVCLTMYHGCTTILSDSYIAIMQ